ncbi:MAG: DoxX family membrane protein [Candidatus Pacebacteria bacterium]|nr:DoxX family membrane protein [Candidatus Paceibacterota bacterium]
MKRITYFLLTLVALPSVALAHVKWFAEPEVVVPDYRLGDPFVLGAVIGAFVLVCAGIYLEKKLKVPHRLDKVIQKWAPGVLSIASIGFGLAFIIFALKGFVFAPNLPAVGNIGYLMLAIEFIAGVLMLLGFYERIGGLMVLVLFALGINQYGGIEMLDTLEMVGFAFYIIIIGRPKWKMKDWNFAKNLSHKIHSYGLPILRVGTGLNLIVLGFTEKILTPSLTNNFLTNYDWNFMQKLGFEGFTNYYFGFYAGVVEVLFGVFFVLGLVTRTTTIALAVFLVTTLYLLGPIELIGHLPHFSIAIVLFVLGSGTKMVLVHTKKLK